MGVRHRQRQFHSGTPAGCQTRHISRAELRGGELECDDRKIDRQVANFQSPLFVAIE